jgi:serine/threonine-protein phosphatase 2A regulatory subunit A
LVQRLLPLIVATIDDRSWRVRWTAASKFADVIDAYQNIPNTMDALVPAYEKLLQDPEAEVRTAATFNLAAVCKCPAQVLLEDTQTEGGEGGDAAEKGAAQQKQPPLDAPRVSVAERLVKRVTNLTEDDSEHVRAALALVATELAPILGKDATITHLVPPVLLLLRDAASEVRLNLISSLSALNQVIGVDLLSQSLLPAILDLAQDGKWRIRLAIIQHIPLLAKQLGKEFFSDKLASLCVGWLGDDISSIRQASATNLKELVSLFGTAWATQYIIPSIKDIRKHPSYLRRLTAVQACAMMSTEMDVEVVKTELLPMVLEMAADTVSFTFCWCFYCHHCVLFSNCVTLTLTRHLLSRRLRFRISASMWPRHSKRLHRYAERRSMNRKYILFCQSLWRIPIETYDSFLVMLCVC